MALASFASQYSQGLTGHTFSVVLSYILVSNDSSMASFKREDKKKTKKQKQNKQGISVQGNEARSPYAGRENPRAEGKGIGPVIALY